MHIGEIESHWAIDMTLQYEQLMHWQPGESLLQASSHSVEMICMDSNRTTAATTHDTILNDRLIFIADTLPLLALRQLCFGKE